MDALSQHDGGLELRTVTGRALLCEAFLATGRKGAPVAHTIPHALAGVTAATGNPFIARLHPADARRLCVPDSVSGRGSRDHHVFARGPAMTE